MCESQVSQGGFSLTKRAPKEILFARISFSFQKAPDDTGVSSAAALDQRRCPLDTRHLLKNVDENFICRNWVPRSRWRPTVHWKVGLGCA